MAVQLGCSIVNGCHVAGQLNRGIGGKNFPRIQCSRRSIENTAVENRCHVSHVDIAVDVEESAFVDLDDLRRVRLGGIAAHAPVSRSCGARLAKH